MFKLFLSLTHERERESRKKNYTHCGGKPQILYNILDNITIHHNYEYRSLRTIHRSPSFTLYTYELWITYVFALFIMLPSAINI